MTGYTATTTATDDAGVTATLSASFTVQAQPVFGANSVCYGQIASSAVGPMAGYRAYNSAAIGIPASWPGPQAGPVPAGATCPVISIKPSMALVGTAAGSSALAKYAAQAPPGSWLTCWHEGEQADHHFTPAQILALHAWAYPVVKKANPAVRYGQIFMCFTATSAGRHPITQWVAPGLDWYGLDGYMTVSTQTPKSVFGPAFQQVLAGEPDAVLAITESNADQAAWRPAWHKGAYQFAQQNKCLAYFPFYFSQADTTGKISWLPSDSATITALAGLNAISVS